jgi:hypothetical protein
MFIGILIFKREQKPTPKGGEKMETLLAFGHIVFYTILWIA